jgi:hypothetical protein
MPGHRDNYYDSFELCPSEAMRQKLNRADVLIENWHTLMPLKEQERSVVKKGKESDEAFTKRVLGKLATHKDLIVINDEAHHAYRTPADVKISKAEAEAQALTWTRPPAGWRGWTACTKRGAFRAASTCRPRPLRPPGAPTPRPACSVGWCLTLA